LSHTEYERAAVEILPLLTCKERKLTTLAGSIFSFTGKSGIYFC